MTGMTRRAFVKGSMAGAAVTALPFSRVHGANDAVRVGSDHARRCFTGRSDSQAPHRYNKNGRNHQWRQTP